MNPALWANVNRNLIAKSLGELTYEEILKPEALSDSTYRVQLKSGVSYEFQAWMSIWTHLRVKPESIVRIADQTLPAVSAGQFFIDAQSDLDLTDIILGNFLEEMHSTLYSDLQMLSQPRFSAEALSLAQGDAIQKVLNGHPKILLNKGRMGFSASDLKTYAPESDASFQLHWLAVHRESAVEGAAKGFDKQSLLNECMNESEIIRFEATAKRKISNLHEYLYLPVHPWQWDQRIQIQFMSEIASQKIVSLGTFGDFYSPHISIRTLANLSRPDRCDVKLPLSILNTSAVRGIPARYIPIAPSLSAVIAGLCETDSLLKTKNTGVLKEKYGLSFAHPLYTQVKGAPYRYPEQLGVVLRESAVSRCLAGENAILTASLFYQDDEGHSLIGAYIRRSGLSTEAWLKLYFDTIVIPLYHLQLKYGVGLVAHGQNIVLKLKDFKPVGMLMKDFQGDLRLSKKELETQTGEFALLRQHLDQLSPDYLIHDLITGHFLTVLRFISEVLFESEKYPETQFYQILAQCIQTYIATQKPALAIESSQDLLQPHFHRVLLNKVRFKIGYADSAERPLPLVGSPLQNPISIRTEVKHE